MNHRHLLLTSSGLSDSMKKIFFDIIGKSPKDLKILYIPTAGIETDGAREGLAVCLDELVKMGICYENILVYNLELLLSKDYKRTYSQHIKSPAVITRLLTIEELKRFDAVFVSGGSMYAAGNLEDGLHIIPNPIIPHWEENKLVELPKGEKEIQLVDGQAVYIENDKIRLI